MLPVTSRNVADTLSGASIIGKLPASPLVTPRAAVNTNADASPAITGWSRGEQHNNISGTNSALKPDISISCLRDQLYGTAANNLPTTSDVLNVNMSNTGIHVPRLHDIISDSIPGYRDSVTQYANAIQAM